MAEIFENLDSSKASSRARLEQQGLEQSFYDRALQFKVAQNSHVRYINILTWLRGFQVKLLYLVLFFQVSYGNWGTKETWKIRNFDPKASNPFYKVEKIQSHLKFSKI